MRRKIVILLISIVLMSLFIGTVLAEGIRSGESNGIGPAPNSGDCFPNGSGFDSSGNCQGNGAGSNCGEGNPDCPFR